MKFKNLLSVIAIATVVLMFGCHKDDNNDLVLSPTVSSTDPANNEMDVFLNKVVSVTFSEEMDPLTINSSTFTVKQGENSVLGIVSYSGTTATFTPAVKWTKATNYTATITTGAKNLNGLGLISIKEWSFTTGNTEEILSPTVNSTDPANKAMDVVRNKIINVTFSKAMNASTLSTSSFTLKQGETAIEGTVSYIGTTASFKPTTILASNTTYTAAVTTEAKDVSGIALKEKFVWGFTTGSSKAPTVISTDPIDRTTSVAFDKVISATFSEEMDPLTITTSSFTLMLGTTIVSGTVNYSGTKATFTPTNNLIAGTYTATITSETKSVDNIPIMSDYVWSFSTNTSIGVPAVNLKSVERFGIIAGVGVSNNAGFSIINDMDVGIYPGVLTSVTGFPPAIIENGAIYAADNADPVPAMLIQAKQDLSDAFLFAERATSSAPITVAGDQGGKTLAPGIYKSLSTLLIQSGNLTLDAQGDENAVWIFQIASDFTTIGGAGGDVILTGGAQAKNIFWQTGRSATIGDYTSFKGNILALTSITMNAYAVAEGRMLARNGAVVMTHTNTINKP